MRKRNLAELYRNTLRDDLRVLDDERRGLLKSLLWIAIPSLVSFAVILFGGLSATGISENVYAFIWCIPVAIALHRWAKRWFAFRSKFKHRVIERLVKFYDPGLRYEPTLGITESQYEDSVIFLKDHDRYHSEDLVRGTLGRTAVSFSDVHTEYKTVHTDSDGRTQERWHTIFEGIFFTADFNKHFSGMTVVLPDTAEKYLGRIGNFFQRRPTSRPGLIKLEDPEFEREFVVYSHDQIEARYILSTSLMRRLLTFRRRHGSDVFLSFVDERVNVAIATGRDHFEPKLFSTIKDFPTIEAYFREIELFARIVEDLDLNTRIWTKE